MKARGTKIRASERKIRARDKERDSTRQRKMVEGKDK